MKDKRTGTQYSIRLSPEAVRQLEALMTKWGENRSQAISRAITLATEKKDEAMKYTYQLKNYGTRISPKWSIDEHLSGEFISQVAFWFSSRAEAEARLAEIVKEDAKK